MEEIGEHISQLNETTSHLYNSLSSSSSQQEDTASALLLQFESELFEVSVLHHRCWTKLQEKLKLLKNLEKDVTSLQESIESLSALLTSAQGLIARREGIMNVQDYLEECKVREGESDMRLGTRMEEGERGGGRDCLFIQSE